MKAVTQTSRATILYPDGRREDIQPASGKFFALAELQQIVGGYIELVRVGERLLVVNEDGRSSNLPRNPAATLLAAGFIFPGDAILGTVVLTDPELID